MNTEDLSNKLQLANSIFVEWKGFSAEIVSLYASSGIGGHLYIILSGFRQSFALGIGVTLLWFSAIPAIYPTTAEEMSI
jgi:hypothetical protein